MRMRVDTSSLDTTDERYHKTTKNYYLKRGLVNMKWLAEAKPFQRELYEEAMQFLMCQT